jgi:hypothetical protein
MNPAIALMTSHNIVNILECKVLFKNEHRAGKMRPTAYMLLAQQSPFRGEGATPHFIGVHIGA